METNINFLIDSARRCTSDSGHVMPQYAYRYEILMRMIADYYLNGHDKKGGEMENKEKEEQKKNGCWLNCTLSPTGQIMVRLERAEQRGRRSTDDGKPKETRTFAL